MHRQWGKTPKLPLPWDFVTQPEEDQATAIGNMHKNLVKITRLVQEISSQTDRLTDKHRHTDVLITILRHCSHGRSNKIQSALKLALKIYNK